MMKICNTSFIIFFWLGNLDFGIRILSDQNSAPKYFKETKEYTIICNPPPPKKIKHI